MKIILPYSQSDFFTPADLELLEGLDLSTHALIDIVLENWVKYNYAEAWDRYEHVVDAVTETFNHDGSPHESHRSIILAENADQLADLASRTANRLQYLLNDLPDETVRSERYDYLTVAEEDPRAKTLTLKTE